MTTHYDEVHVHLRADVSAFFRALNQIRFEVRHTRAANRALIARHRRRRHK